MIDLYVDDVSLTEIQDKHDQHILVFKNKDKDESVHIPVTDQELINILNRTRMRCETLELIYPVDIKIRERGSKGETSSS